VIRDADGNLYGTTYSFGSGAAGVVYKLDTAGHETAYGFPGAAGGDGLYAGVIPDSAGNLYGTTIFGGSACDVIDGTCFYGSGVVYRLDTSGQETALYSFTGGADGANPEAGVIRDSAGNLYGTTSGGGIIGATCYSGCGVVYRLDTSGQETVLYSFTGGADGAYPYAGVIRDLAGNLYGTTPNGGSGEGSAGYGVVYKLDVASPGQEAVLYTFTGGADGANPYASVIRDSAGNLYGTTEGGGSGIGFAGAGVVFKVNTAGQEAVLYTFTGGTDGAYPLGGVIRDSTGNLYGTTAGGGMGYGVVYKLDVASGQETVLYSFTGGADGANPEAGVILDSAGNLYGTTYGGGTGYGVVYKLDVASGQEAVLYSFTGETDGAKPEAGVILDLAGNLYGTTSSGGADSGGVVFKLEPQ
jgi:uncharacterized repeat protein (TIGR03803 family)